MRVAPKPYIKLFGPTGRDKLFLNKAEKAALRRASRIAGEIQERLEALGVLLEDDTFGITLSEMQQGEDVIEALEALDWWS